MLTVKVILILCFLYKVISHANPSIIIIGSGPSGIAAATRLLKNNFTNLTILEAEGRIGGRIHSVSFGDAFVDMGAQFCHGEEGNIVYSLVKQLGLLKHSRKNQHFYYSNGDEAIESTIGDKILQFAESLEGGEGAINICEHVASIGQCLEIKFNNFSKSFQNPHIKRIIVDSSDWIRSHLCAFDSPFDINDLKIMSAYKKCAGDLRLNWNGLGYKTILEVMMQQLPIIKDKIFTNTEVTSIENWSSNDKVLLNTTNGTTFEAQHIIFTPSLGVLKANHENLFKPNLPPKKIDAIKNIGFGAIMKIQIHFPQRWWLEDANWLLIWSEEDKKILKQRNLYWLTNLAKILQAENNPNVLTAWYAGKFVPLIETLPEPEVLDAQNYLMQSFFNHSQDADSIIRSTWYSNPHFRGTYSYESVKGHGEGGFPEVLARPLKNKNKLTVLFAGEATHPYYFSTVHGAIESGYREADRLIQFYNN